MKGIFLKYLLMCLAFEVNFSSSSLPTILNTGSTVTNASSWRISIWCREVSYSQKGPSKKEGVKVRANSRMVFLVFWILKRNQLAGDFQLYPAWWSQWGVKWQCAVSQREVPLWHWEIFLSVYASWNGTHGKCEIFESIDLA